MNYINDTFEEILVLKENIKRIATFIDINSICSDIYLLAIGNMNKYVCVSGCSDQDKLWDIPYSIKLVIRKEPIRLFDNSIQDVRMYIGDSPIYSVVNVTLSN